MKEVFGETFAESCLPVYKDMCHFNLLVVEIFVSSFLVEFIVSCPLKVMRQTDVIAKLGWEGIRKG